MSGLATSPCPWRTTADGIALRVRVTPKSSRDAVEGIEPSADGPAVKVRVRAVPDKGQANAAVESAIAAWLGVAKASVTLAAGGKSRIKVIAIKGVAAVLAQRIAVLLATERPA